MKATINPININEVLIICIRLKEDAFHGHSIFSGTITIKWNIAPLPNRTECNLAKLLLFINILKTSAIWCTDQ